MEPKALIPVAVLCVRPKSIYKTMPGLEVFDQKRDARTFAGKMKAIGHPPCRHWSRFCRHQADQSTREHEQALGLWIAQQIQHWGGILEQPAFSNLFVNAGLPLPGRGDDNSWSIEVWQSWWGYPQIKRTWLYFSKIPRRFVHFPFALHPEGRDKRCWQVMAKSQRSLTTSSFANWLVDTVRRSCA